MGDIKALVGGIQKFSTEDGPGIRTTVFLKGCPLNCLWCHNPEMISPHQQIIISPSKCIGCRECEKMCPNNGIQIQENGPVIDWQKCEGCCLCTEVCYSQAIMPVAKWMTIAEVMEIIMQDKAFYDNTGGGVTLSGGEMLMQDMFCKALIEACAKENVEVCLDTSGFSSFDVLHDLAIKENVVAILYDMKHICNEKHRQYTGSSNGIILDNLSMLARDPLICKKLWLRMPLIEGLNDDQRTIIKTGRFYRKYGISKVSLIPYHEMGNAKARHIGKKEQNFNPPSKKRLNEIKQYYEEMNIDVEIVGGED